MELRDLRFFCLTAELEHVSKAAEILGVSQPFLSKVISRLEDELGTQLFDTVNRRIKLNKYGEVFYADAKSILVSVEAMTEKIDGMLDKEEKTIRLVADAEGYTIDLLLAYNKDHPQNKMSVTYERRPAIIESLVTGSADFALCTPPITEAESPAIAADIVYQDNGCFLLPPKHPLLGREAITLKDLEDTPLVTSPLGAGARNNFERIFAAYGYEPNIVCESNDMELIIRAVQNGMGFAIMPQKLLRDERLRPYCVRPDMPQFCAQIGLCYNKINSSSSRFERFRYFVADYFEAFKKKDEII